jgi:hypothetical protein
VLKSTNGAAPWQTLGAGAFNSVYPAAAGGTYPQYQAVTKVKVE